MTVVPGIFGQAYISPMEPTIRRAAVMLAAGGRAIDPQVDRGISAETATGTATAGAHTVTAAGVLSRPMGGVADCVARPRSRAEQARAAAHMEAA